MLNLLFLKLAVWSPGLLGNCAVTRSISCRIDCEVPQYLGQRTQIPADWSSRNVPKLNVTNGLYYQVQRVLLKSWGCRPLHRFNAWNRRYFAGLYAGWIAPKPSRSCFFKRHHSFQITETNAKHRNHANDLTISFMSSELCRQFLDKDPSSERQSVWSPDSQSVLQHDPLHRLMHGTIWFDFAQRCSTVFFKINRLLFDTYLSVLRLRHFSPEEHAARRVPNSHKSPQNMHLKVDRKVFSLQLLVTLVPHRYC